METILIHDEFANRQEMANTLRAIADLVEQDYVCGYYPAWEIKATMKEVVKGVPSHEPVRADENDI